MKKIPKSIYLEISPVVLFMEDLEEIEEIYKDNFKDYKIIIKDKNLTNDFEFSSIREFFEEFSKRSIFKLNNFSFESYNPFIHTNFGNTEARIYGSSNDVKSVGIINKLKNAIEKRPWFYKYLGSFYFFFVIIALLLLGGLLSEPYETISLILIILFYIFWSFWWYNLKIKNYSIIYLKKRSLQKGFWDKIKYILGAVALVLGIIGSIVTIIGYFKKVK